MAGPEARRTNMDVPISLGVLLAFGMSLYETMQHGPHAYFDAAISLLFFLLIGRTLDHMMRERARLAVKGLARLAARGALVVQADGTQVYLPVSEIQTGMTIMLAAGERVPVDATVTKGTSELDVSLVSGEHTPVPAVDRLRAAGRHVEPDRPSDHRRDGDTGQFVPRRDGADDGSGRAGPLGLPPHRRSRRQPVCADGPSHGVLTFVGWLLATGDMHRALTIAIAVLIITCPCALGLAVPMVQVVAARRLFESGIMVKDGGALERLAEIDTVVFDKTGTLTLGRSAPGRIGRNRP